MTPQEFRIWADGFTAGRSTCTADEVQKLIHKLYSEVDGFRPSTQEVLLSIARKNVRPGGITWLPEDAA